MRVAVGESWERVLAGELASDWFRELTVFVDQERACETVFPSPENVFHAFRATPFSQVRVVILGQDPYHDEGQAHGLAFSVPVGIKPPPSLRNIFRELADDLGAVPPSHGCLEGWTKQGVLLLNTVLTVRAHQPHSHRGRGWEQLTDAVIEKLSARSEPVIFVLWGKPAQSKQKLIDPSRHGCLLSPHPSPLSARRGFFGSRPFSRINAWLVEQGQGPPIDWLDL